MGAACSGRPSVAAIYSCGQASREASGRRSDSFRPTGSVGCTAEGRWVQMPAHGTLGGPAAGAIPRMDGWTVASCVTGCTAQGSAGSAGVSTRLLRPRARVPRTTIGFVCSFNAPHGSTSKRTRRSRTAGVDSTLATLLARTWKELLLENERDPFVYRTCGGHGGTRGQGGTPGGDNLPGLLSSGRLPGPSAWFRG